MYMINVKRAIIKYFAIILCTINFREFRDVRRTTAPSQEYGHNPARNTKHNNHCKNTSVPGPMGP